MWRDILTAVALLFILEGILPFLSPAALRQTLVALAQSADRTLRLTGLASMLFGLFMLYLVR